MLARSSSFGRDKSVERITSLPTPRRMLVRPLAFGFKERDDKAAVLWSQDRFHLTSSNVLTRLPFSNLEESAMKAAVLWPQGRHRWSCNPSRRKESVDKAVVSWFQGELC